MSNILDTIRDCGTEDEIIFKIRQLGNISVRINRYEYNEAYTDVALWDDTLDDFFFAIAISSSGHIRRASWLLRKNGFYPGGQHGLEFDHTSEKIIYKDGEKVRTIRAEEFNPSDFSND